MPVELLPIAAEAEVFEHRLDFELDLALEIGPVLDADLDPAFEVDELGAEPDVEASDSAHLQLDQVGERAGFHLDRGGIEVLAEHIGGFRRGGAAGAELADDDTVEASSEVRAVKALNDLG